MAGSTVTPRPAKWPAEQHELVVEAVLTMLLDAHPAQVSFEEVVREMTASPNDVTDRDDVHNAVTDLVGAGLLHRHGEFVFATRAAMRFHEVEM
jgi:hypothetical protein